MCDPPSMEDDERTASLYSEVSGILAGHEIENTGDAGLSRLKEYLYYAIPRDKTWKQTPRWTPELKRLALLLYNNATSKNTHLWISLFEKLPAYASLGLLKLYLSTDETSKLHDPILKINGYILNTRTNDLDRSLELLVQRFSIQEKLCEKILLSSETCFSQIIVKLVAKVQFADRKSERNADKAINELKSICEYHHRLLNVDLLDYIVFQIHDRVINNEYASIQHRKNAYSLFIVLHRIAYYMDDLVTVSNIETLIQLAVKEGLVNLNSCQLITMLKGKSENWIDNFLSSLELRLFPNLDSAHSSTPTGLIPWSEVVQYFQFVHFLLSNDIHLDHEKFTALYDLIFRISKIVDVPWEFYESLRVSTCDVISDGYRVGEIPCESLELYDTVLSYLFFSPNETVRSYAMKALVSIFCYDGENMKNALNINEGCEFPHIFHKLIPIPVEDRLSYLGFYRLYTDNISNIVRPPMFSELLYVLYEFPNLKVMQKYFEFLRSLPTQQRETMKELFQNLDPCISWPKNPSNGLFVRFFTIQMTPNPPANAVEKVHELVTPLYPKPSRKETRIYLFSLRRQKKIRISETENFIVFDMLKMEDNDIQDCLYKVFSTLKLSEYVIHSLINLIREQDEDILDFITSIQNIMMALPKSVHKFDIIKACLVGDKTKFDRFLRFFLNLMHIHTSDIRQAANAYSNLLMNVETAYIDWGFDERAVFWDTFFNYTLDQQENHILEYALRGVNDFFNNLRKREEMIFVDNKSAIVFTRDKIGSYNETELRDFLHREIKKSKDEKERAKRLLSQITLEKNKDRKMHIGSDVEILKKKSVNTGANEMEVSITVYPNGKRNAEFKDVRSNKNLDKGERKKLYREMAALDSSNIADYSSYMINLFRNDIFKSCIKGKTHVGKFVGLMFNVDCNFATATNQELKVIFPKVKRCRNFILHESLYLRFNEYLKTRFSSKQSTRRNK